MASGNQLFGVHLAYRNRLVRWGIQLAIEKGVGPKQVPTPFYLNMPFSTTRPNRPVVVSAWNSD